MAIANQLESKKLKATQFKITSNTDKFGYLALLEISETHNLIVELIDTKGINFKLELTFKNGISDCFHTIGYMCRNYPASPFAIEINKC